MTLRRSTGFLNKSGGIKTNKLTNGTFSTDTTGWTASGATLSVSSGSLSIANSGAAVGQAYQDVSTVVGRIYKVTVDFTKGTGVSGSIRIGTTSSPTSILISPSYTDATVSNKALAFVAIATTTRITLQSDSTTSGETALFDNVVLEDVFDGFADIFKGCKINVYTGTQTISADNAATGTLLYTLTNNDDFGQIFWPHGHQCDRANYQQFRPRNIQHNWSFLIKNLSFRPSGAPEVRHASRNPIFLFIAARNQMGFRINFLSPKGAKRKFSGMTKVWDAHNHVSGFIGWG